MPYTLAINIVSIWENWERIGEIYLCYFCAVCLCVCAGVWGMHMNMGKL